MDFVMYDLVIFTFLPHDSFIFMCDFFPHMICLFSHHFLKMISIFSRNSFIYPMRFVFTWFTHIHIWCLRVIFFYTIHFFPHMIFFYTIHLFSHAFFKSKIHIFSADFSFSPHMIHLFSHVIFFYTWFNYFHMIFFLHGINFVLHDFFYTRLT